MRSATGTYRLDSISGAFFAVNLLHFIHRDEAIVGRFGRYGTIRGSIGGRVLSAMWKDQNQHGWLLLTFDPAYGLFEGEYGTGDDVAGRCSGIKVR
jgi:hypothetical protein